jgi:hypothetical protein
LSGRVPLNLFSSVPLSGRAISICLFGSPKFFNPLLDANGAWANTVLGALLDTSAGRGIGFMFVTSVLIADANPRIRNIEDELPDALPATSD